VTAVRIGRVCTRRGARIHLALNGHTVCGVDDRASVSYECVRPDLAEAGNLCLRCFTGSPVGQAQMLLTSSTGGRAERNGIPLSAVVDGMKTPTQRAADLNLAARIARTIELAAPVLAKPLDERPRTWATLRDEYRKTYPQAA